MKSSRRIARRRKIRRDWQEHAEHIARPPQPELLMRLRKRLAAAGSLRKIEAVFWLLYLSLPFFTGWLDYQPLPNEQFDAARHELLDYHVREGWPNGLGTYKVPDAWRDTASGEVYTARSFLEHHGREARRLGAIYFAYGLGSCVLFAYGCLVRKKDTFLRAFRNALMVDAALAIFVFWIT